MNPFSILPHSAFVHMPMALAVLMPAIYLVAWWAIERGKMPDSLWFGVLAFAVVQVVSSLVSVESGEFAEEESGAKADLLHHHEELAETFMGVWWGIFAVMLLAWWFRRTKWAKWAHLLVVGLLCGQMIFAFYVGHAGGDLMR